MSRHDDPDYIQLRPLVPVGSYGSLNGGNTGLLKLLGEAAIAKVTSKFLPTLLEWKLEGLHQRRKQQIIERFEQLIAHFGGSNERRLRNCYNFCSGIYFENDSNTRFHFMQTVVSSYDSDAPAAIQWFNDTHEAIIQRNHKLMKQFAEAPPNIALPPTSTE